MIFSLKSNIIKLPCTTGLYRVWCRYLSHGEPLSWKLYYLGVASFYIPLSVLYSTTGMIQHTGNK